MEVRFTPSARASFLEAVVRLRDRDRATASRFVDRVERTLRRLGDEPDLGAEIRMTGDRPDVAEQHRFYYRVRATTVWILAVWSYAESSPFVDALRATFSNVEAIPVTAMNDLVDEEQTDWLFVAHDERAAR